MGDQIIVLVSDRGDSKHGEISILDDPHKAERLVETLLEAGFEEDRIRVFTGKASEFQIRHRPVVALVAEGEEEGPQAAEPERPKPESPKVEVEEPASEAQAAESEAEEEASGDTGESDEAPVEAGVATPVRFSSLFRSA